MSLRLSTVGMSRPLIRLPWRRPWLLCCPRHSHDVRVRRTPT